MTGPLAPRVVVAASPQIIKKGARLAPRVVQQSCGKRFLRLTGLTAGGFLSLTAFQAEGCGIALRAMSIIMPPFGGHVHIEYHNHSYPRTSLRHFVALFP